MKSSGTRLFLVTGALLAAVTGCAHSSAPPAGGVTAAEALQQVDTRISGDVRQRTAGEIVAYHEVQDAIVACMAKGGWTYAAPSFTDVYAGRAAILPGDGLGVFAALKTDALGLADDAMLLAAPDPLGPNPGYTSLSDIDKSRYAETLSQCSAKSTGRHLFPAARGALYAKWQKMLAGVAAKPAVRSLSAKYAKCMKSAGLPVTSVSDLYGYVQAKVDAQPVPVPGGQGSVGWSAVQTLDRKAAGADARCRQPARDAALGLAATPINTFATVNAAAITTVQQQWQAMVDKAMTFPEGKRYLSR